MATLSPSTPHPSRAPPPFLFSGPPSGNASAASLNLNPPSTSTKINTASNSNNTSTNSHLNQTPSRAPLLTRSRSLREPDSTSSSPLRNSTKAAGANINPSFNYYENTTRTNSNNTNSSNKRTTAASEGDSTTDAPWKEMQATLAEGEVSAFHSTHVFGQAHAVALEELRAAQIQLAQAWGRDVGVDGEDVKEGRTEKGDGDYDDGDDDDDGDIIVARKRREANERFFEKVREGVRDVVGRLEGVAEKMGKVERESREIWKGERTVRPGTPDS